MLVINQLKQDTQEWLDWRSNGCGASDALTILGRSQHKTRWRLWAEKIGIILPEDLSQNPNVRRGKRLEQAVRHVIEQKLGVKLDVFCGHDDKYNWRLVSFDGVTPDNIPVEIKCPSTKLNGNETEEELETFNDRYLDLVENGRDSALFRDYEVQLQYQIGMLDAPYGYLAFYFEKNNEMKIFKVPRNDTEIRSIFEAVDDFYLNHIQTGVEPEKDKLLDYYEPTENELIEWDCHTMDFLEAVESERKLKQELKRISENKRLAAEKLLEKTGDFKMLNLHGIKITASTRETFQYKDFLAEKGITITQDDKEKHSKRSRVSVRISAIRDKKVLAEVKSNALSHQQQLANKLMLEISEEEEDMLLNRSDLVEDGYYED